MKLINSREGPFLGDVLYLSNDMLFIDCVAFIGTLDIFCELFLVFSLLAAYCDLSRGARYYKPK